MSVVQRVPHPQQEAEDCELERVFWGLVMVDVNEPLQRVPHRTSCQLAVDLVVVVVVVVAWVFGLWRNQLVPIHPQDFYRLANTTYPCVSCPTQVDAYHR